MLVEVLEKEKIGKDSEEEDKTKRRTGEVNEVSRD